MGIYLVGVIMIVIRLIFLCLSFFMHAMHASEITQTQEAPVKLLIIDTAGQQEYYYRNMILLAQSVGFNVEFKNFYQIISDDDHKDLISKYDAVFFLTSLDLLKNLKSDLSRKFIQILESFASARNKLIGFLVPSTPRYNDMLFKITVAIAETIGTFKDKQGVVQKNALLRQPLYTFLRYMLQGDAQKGAMYGTTLINQGQSSMPAILDEFGQPFTNHVDNQTQEVIATLLPIKQDFSPIIQKTLPSGMYIKNRKLNNIYFISKVSEFNFADVAENFFKTPLHLNQRQELLMVAQQMLVELYNAYTTGAMQLDAQVTRPPLPKKLTLSFMKQEKRRADAQIKNNIKNNPLYDWIIKQGISCAWEEPNDYFLHEDYGLSERTQNADEIESLKEQALEQGIKFLYDARINVAWFEFNPELYLCPHGKNKGQKKQFIDRVTKIAIALKQQFSSDDRPLPQIFMGTDITSNYRTHIANEEFHPVHQAAQDVFNNTYSKIPSPLDFKHFWQPELTEIFDIFYSTFGKVLPITGVFLDFEMYHAQDQASGYSDMMDFSTISWELYSKTDKNAQGLGSVPERVAYLTKNKGFKKYFKTLEHEAHLLGHTIKKHLQKIMPNVVIGAYAMTLPHSWFYRGMFAGLGSKESPLILATFNTDVYSHYRWLLEHDIHVIHGAPIMLSKIQTTKDLSLISELLQYHYFVWYLRPSRMVYDKTKLKNIWFGSEMSPLNKDTLATGIAIRNDSQRIVHEK